MAGNNHLIPLNEHRWQRGYRNLVRAGFSGWWKTNTWWIQILIWGGILLMLLSGFLFATDEDPQAAYLVFSLVLGLFVPIAVVIITQDEIVGEKKSGTAAWVLSKPVTPIAFILSKFVSNLSGMLITMVIAPAMAGFLLIGIATGAFPNLPGFLAGIAVLCVNCTFFLTLSLMLGTLFDEGGPVIAIPLAVHFGQQLLIGLFGPAAIYLPWAMLLPVGGNQHGVVSALMVGATVSSWVPVMLVTILTLLFFMISVRRFAKQEF